MEEVKEGKKREKGEGGMKERERNSKGEEGMI